MKIKFIPVMDYTRNPHMMKIPCYMCSNPCEINETSYKEYENLKNPKNKLRNYYLCINCFTPRWKKYKKGKDNGKREYT